MQSFPRFTRSSLWVEFTWVGGMIFGGNFIVREQFSGGQLSSGAIIRGQFSLGAIILRDNCPEGNYPGGNFTLFHVFNYGTCMEIFLFYKFFPTKLAWIRNSSTIFRSSHRRCSIKKLFLKMLWYSQESNCVGVSFLLNLKAFRPLTVLKKDVNTDIFLWISRNL